jgi:hypothetical protein
MMISFSRTVHLRTCISEGDIRNRVSSSVRAEAERGYAVRKLDGQKLEWWVGRSCGTREQVQHGLFVGVCCVVFIPMSETISAQISERKSQQD